MGANTLSDPQLFQHNWNEIHTEAVILIKEDFAYRNHQHQNIHLPSLKYNLGHYLFVLPQLQIVNLCLILFGMLIQNIVHFKTCKLVFLPRVLLILTFCSAVSKGNSLGKLIV